MKSARYFIVCLFSVFLAAENEGGNSFTIWITSRPNKDLPIDFLQCLFKLTVDSLQGMISTKQAQQTESDENLDEPLVHAMSLQNVLQRGKIS